MTVATIGTPRRTVGQRMAALERANAIRTFRAQLKVTLKRRDRSLIDLLEAPPSEIETMKVFTLLMALPKCGRVKANRLLSRLAISPSKTVGGLTPRQRAALLSALRAWRVVR